MNPRLIRALERGGLTAKLIEPGWGVWRHRDRRCRMIGTFTNAEIDLLQLYECLQPRRAFSCQEMCWQAPNTQSRACVEDLIASRNDPIRSRSCLDQLLLSHRCDADRAHLVSIARAFRRDALSTTEQVEGNNESCDRLGLIVASLSERECRLLYDLAVSRATKSVLAKSYELRPAAVETKAIEVLRHIADIYL